jgi:uncharacterized protein YjbI with pentapeptide repeats/broad specificity phosphatase PhoE
MSLGIEPALTTLVVAQNPSNLNTGVPESGAPANPEPKKGAANAGSLGQPVSADAKSGGLNGAIAIGGPPMRRVGAIVSTAERGAIQRMEQRTPVRVVVPNIRVPQGSSGGAVLRAILPPGSIYVRTGASPTAPLVGYQPTSESLSVVESSFTPQRITAFGALGNEQKVLARSLLADLLPRLQAGTISEAEFNAGVGLVLQSAQRYQPSVPAQSTAMTSQPVPRQPPVVPATPSGTQATAVPVVPGTPRGTQATDVPQAPTSPSTAIVPTPQQNWPVRTPPVPGSVPVQVNGQVSGTMGSALPPLAELVTVSGGTQRYVAPSNREVSRLVARGERIEGPVLQLAGCDLRNVPNLRQQIEAVQRSTLSNVNVPMLRIDLTNANLRGVDLSGLDLTAARLDGADLTGANLSGTDLQNARLLNTNLTRVNLSRSNLAANFSGATLRQANLSASNLSGSSFFNADMQGANLDGVEAYGTSFRRANMSFVTARGANLANTDLDEANLKHGNFANATLGRASLQDALVDGTSFRNTNLYRTDFTGTPMRVAETAGAKNYERPAETPDAARTRLTRAAARDTEAARNAAAATPDLDVLNRQGRASITPEMNASWAKRGLTLVNVQTIVGVRHAESVANARGPFFAGNGPGIPLSARGREEARSLQPVFAKLAPQLGAAFVTSVGRGKETLIYGAEGVPGMPAVQVGDYLRERGVGALFDQDKPTGARRPISRGAGQIAGAVGRGVAGFDINNLGVNYVPPNDPYSMEIPGTFATDGRGESWAQMYERTNAGVLGQIAPEMAKGKNVLITAHQFSLAMILENLYREGDQLPAGKAMYSGRDIPNAAPLYWTVGVLRDQQGKYHLVPLNAGQSTLGAPRPSAAH